MSQEPTVEVQARDETGVWRTVRLNEVRVKDRRRNAPAPAWSKVVEKR